MDLFETVQSINLKIKDFETIILKETLGGAAGWMPS